MQPARIFAIALFVALGLGATACSGGSSDGPDDNWGLGSDGGNPDAASPADTVDCPRRTTYDPARDRCVPHDLGDTADPGTDTSPADTFVSRDTGPTEPTPTFPTVGDTFQGPRISGDGNVPIQKEHGVGLYWKNALTQFGKQTLHQHIHDQKIMDLSRISTPAYQEQFEARIPKAPPEKLHFYRNYCDEVGAQTCKNQNIDDDRATFAMAMVGVHKASESAKPSECTWQMVQGKVACRFGSVAAPSRTILMYVYRPFSTGTYQVFQNIGAATRKLTTGYYKIYVPSGDAPATIYSASKLNARAIRVGSSRMFPMLYP